MLATCKPPVSSPLLAQLQLRARLAWLHSKTLKRSSPESVKHSNSRVVNSIELLPPKSLKNYLDIEFTFIYLIIKDNLNDQFYPKF
jgi:hypothetical protein